MTPQQENELFDYLWRVPRFREWVTDQLNSTLNKLMSMQDIEILRKEQGTAQFLKRTLDKLEGAEKSARSK